MKAVVQRVTTAQVQVAGKTIAQIGQGLLVLIGIATGDTERDGEKLAQKIVELRIFADADNKFNLSLKQIGGEILLIPQFTLFAEVKGQNRPFFGKAAKPEKAQSLFNYFINSLLKLGIKKVASGKFGAYMQVELINNGPVTIILDTNEF